MWHNDYQYYAQVESVDGESIGDVRLDVDWIPALRCAEFEHNMKECRSLDDRSTFPVIEPIWSPESGDPYVHGVMIRLNAQDAETVSFPLTYFSNAAAKASTRLLESGALIAGQQFEYRIYALADVQSREPVAAGIDIVALAAFPSIERVELAAFMAQAEADTITAASNWTGRKPSRTIPILIPQSVLEDATRLAQSVGDVESGGILVGRLYRDANGTLFSKVTAQIPAEHTTATRESLRFTPDTWVSVDAAIRLRNMEEIPLGWWHSHPWWCRNCRSEHRLLCPYSVPTFSVADRGVHREVFQQPWSIALLLSFLGGKQPSYDVFGWNQGQIEELVFTTLPDRAKIKEND